jgi:hypothetical protein
MINIFTTLMAKSQNVSKISRVELFSVLWQELLITVKQLVFDHAPNVWIHKGLTIKTQ